MSSSKAFRLGGRQGCPWALQGTLLKMQIDAPVPRLSFTRTAAHSPGRVWSTLCNHWCW